MKEPKLTYYIKNKWKKRKKPSFHFYFILFVTIILLVAVALAIFLTDLTNPLFGNQNENTVGTFLILIAYALVIGTILSVFIGYFIIAPIKSLRDAMNRVAEGDLKVKVMGESYFDEVDDLNHAFNVMMQQLNATEIVQSDFITNVSHEFKTPLNAIEGYATLLQDENLTKEERREYLDKIIFSSHKVNELMANVLLLSKLDNQIITSNITVFSADEQIRQVIVFLEPKWAQKNIALDVELEEINFNGNESITNHLWINLIGNAIKYTPENSEIQIRLTKENGSAVFTVKDQGAGIKESEMKYIFNKFYQGDGSHKQEGNGLGLALVKRIVDIYGGSVSCSNAEEGGALFKVIIPIQ